MLKKIIFNIKTALTIKENPNFYNNEVIKRWTSKEDFPFLISFPRTGSHWLRMLMELYFERPALTRAFYYPYVNEFTCYHTHDLELTIKRSNIIYLFRSPEQTVYSQLKYHEQDLNDKILVKYWSNIYGLHLSKWLIQENFTKKKTIICYERMQDNLVEEFEKICCHYGKNFNKNKFFVISRQVSKKEIKVKTTHDLRVINLSKKYGDEKKKFIDKHGLLIRKMVLLQDNKLGSVLKSYYGD